MLGLFSVLLVLFSLIIVILIGVTIVLTRSYNNFYKEVHEANKEKDTVHELHTSSQINQITRLATEFNRLILHMQDIKNAADDKESELKHAIENMSHDLRTPLTSIKGYFALLQSPNTTDKEREEYYTIITKKIAALEQLISGFYELSRMQNNDYKMHEEKVNLGNSFIEEMVSFYTEFERVGIEPEIDIADNLPPVFADPFVIQRIFNNLITNAIKYSDGDFKVSMHLSDDGESIVSTFANGAKDMDDETASHLKERFFTADRTRTGQSTGIGLALVDTFLSNMGNSINCKKIGDDIVFTIVWNLPKSV